MASTSISGWSGAGSRKFTLTASTAHKNDTTETVTFTVSISGETYWYNSHLNVWQYDVDNDKSYGAYNEYATWDSGVWFTQAGKSNTWTDDWTRTKVTRNIRVYIQGYANQYSDLQSYVSLTIPAKTQYTITYNKNATDSSIANMPTNGSKWYGENYTISSTKPTRNSYKFLGWSSTNGATTIDTNYDPGDTYSTNANLNLYAVWRQLYTISYNANGGSGAPSSQTKEKGVTLTLSSTKPTRTGYTFKGWATTSTATTATYSAGGSYTADGNQTLYAVWQQNTFTVSYDANGGSNPPDPQTKTYGVTLVLSSTKPTRNNYEFLGWSTSSTATSATYAAGGNYTANASTTLFAVWRQTYSITYNLDGGSPSIPAQTKSHGISITLSSTVPTKSNFDFVNWKDQNSSTTYNPGATYTSNANLSLKAIWRAKYTLTYDYNVGSSTTYDNIHLPTGQSPANLPATQYKSAGTAINITSTIPTSTGYICDHWNTNANNTGDSYTAGAQYNDDGDQTFYAIWTPKTYAITYNKNTTDTVIDMPAGQTKTYGVTLKLSTVSPRRSGYAFKGWGSSSTATTPAYQPGNNFTSNAKTTLYAIWVQTYSITYNKNEGTGNNQVPTSRTVKDMPSDQTKENGTAITLTNTTPSVSDPENNTTYTFVGWGTSSSATTASYQPGNTYSGNAKLDLYAIWKTQYKISYNANGGSGAPSYQQKTKGTTLVLSSTKPTRTGYTFKGWATTSTATTATYNAGGNFTTNAVTTLYAVWEGIPTSITASAVTLGQSCNVTWTPPLTSFKYRLEFSIGDWSSGLIPTGSTFLSPNTTSPWNYTDYSIPLESSTGVGPAYKITNSKTGTMTVKLYTYDGSGNSIGNKTTTFTVTVPNNNNTKPAFSSSYPKIVPYSSNSTVNNWSKYIAGYSVIRSSATASGKYGATISKIVISGADSYEYNGSSFSNHDSSIIGSPGNKTITFTAYDSRGYTTSTSLTANFLEYYTPKINFSAYRKTDELTTIIVSCKCDIASCGGSNGLASSNPILVSYKENISGTSYTTLEDRPTSPNFDLYINGTYAGKTYKIRIQVKDKLTTQYVSVETTVPTAGVWEHMPANGQGVAFGKYAETGHFEINYPLEVYSDIKVIPQSIGGSSEVTGQFLGPGSVEFIRGTQASSTNAWTGVTRDSELYEGKMILYILPYAGNTSNATLTLTLSGGSTSGAKPVYKYDANPVTTDFSQGSRILMTYTNGYWYTETSDHFKVSAAAPSAETLYYPLLHTGTSGTTTALAHANALFRIRAGTASVNGYASLCLGNSTASGTAGNSSGYIRLYGSSSGYVLLQYTNSTATPTITFPTTTGTLINTAGGQTISGTLTTTGALRTNSTLRADNLLTLYRESATTDNSPAGIVFTNKDTTTGISDSAYIRAYNAHYTAGNGANMVISPGGNLFIGSGEGPANHYSLYTSSTTEHTYITADSNIFLQANGGTIANRKGFYINTNQNIIPCVADVATNNVGGLGTSSYRIANIYSTNLNSNNLTVNTSGSITDLTAGNLVVTGNGSFSNNLQANKINGVTVGSSPKFTDTTYSSLAAASGGTAVSLVTTGEKYTWNNKSTLAIGTTATTAAAGNHTHTASLATSTGTSVITLAAGGKYVLTAGGSTVIFTMPADNNTDTKVKITAVNPTDEIAYYPLMYTATSGTVEVNAYDYLRHWIKKGTTSSVGYDFLGIGNNLATGTANNSYGCLRLYGNGTKYAQIRYDSEANASANTTHYLPKTGGTLLNTGTVADYVVEEGTWGSHGKYIKWNSGIAECFGWDSTTTAINSTYGSAGIAYKALTVTFPSIFTASPCTDITLQRNGGLIWPSIYSISTTSVSFYIGSATTESSATIYFHVIAKGFWK